MTGIPVSSGESIPVSSGESMVHEALKGGEATESHVPPHTGDV